jgi:hypothetical protein
MKRLLTTLFCCIMLFVTLGASAEASPIRNCASPSRAIHNLTTRMFTCKEARRIARDYLHGNPYRLNMKETVNYNTGNGWADVRLTRHGYVVRFQMAQD